MLATAIAVNALRLKFMIQLPPSRNGRIYQFSLYTQYNQAV